MMGEAEVQGDEEVRRRELAVSEWINLQGCTTGGKCLGG